MIAVVIPSYRVKRHVLAVIEAMPLAVDRIYVVDDCCPEQSGAFVEAANTDRRVRVIYHEKNQGVGGATLTGYRAAYEEGADVVVKVDGDGQMDPALIPQFVEPVLAGQADYTKGNRFFDPRYLSAMPAMRLFGNLVLSFVSKLSSGYWDIMDPTNGYTALAARLYPLLNADRIERRYFFESDMLFRLGLAQAVVRDVPMRPVYGDEESSLSIRKTALEFPAKHLSRFIKRVGYTYFVRDFNIGTLQLVVGVLLLLFGVIFGSIQWARSMSEGIPATSGTVMLAGLPIILGFQSLLSAVQFDILRIPRLPVHTRLFGMGQGKTLPVESPALP